MGSSSTVRRSRLSSILAINPTGVAMPPVTRAMTNSFTSGIPRPMMITSDTAVVATMVKANTGARRGRHDPPTASAGNTSRTIF